VLASTVRTLLRRWYILAAGVALTAGLCWLAAGFAPTTYGTTASILLLPPEKSANGVIGNPYLSLGGLEGVADVVTTAMTDDSTAQALDDAGLAAEYTMDRDRALAGPIITLIVDGRSSKDALGAQQFLLDRLPLTLQELQVRSDVSVGSRVRSTTVTADTDAQPDRKALIRALIVAGAAGVGLTLMTAALVDGFLLSRRRGFGRGTGSETLRAA
jgi:uncharacterized protein involved in exopolysaccharide biosynthesis